MHLATNVVVFDKEMDNEKKTIVMAYWGRRTVDEPIIENAMTDALKILILGQSE